MTIWPHLQKGFPNGAQPSSQSSQSGVIGDTEFWILLYWLLVRCSGRVTGKCLHQLAKMVYQGTLQDDLLARSATILIVYILHTVYRVTLMTLKQCTHKHVFFAAVKIESRFAVLLFLQVLKYFECRRDLRSCPEIYFGRRLTSDWQCLCLILIQRRKEINYFIKSEYHVASCLSDFRVTLDSEGCFHFNCNLPGGAASVWYRLHLPKASNSP